MRKLQRSVAKHNMEKAGVQRMNKRPWLMSKAGIPYRGDSIFAQKWRVYCAV